MIRTRHFLLLLVTGLSWFLLGCSQGPTSVRVAPTVDNPQKVGQQALAAYDANGDGFLAGDELQACPGLLWDLSKYDVDGDQRVSQEEIAQRVSQWVKEGAGLLSFSCRVTLNGRPLESAEVKLVPEEFLGSGVKEAVGYTDANGNAQLSLAPDNLPEGSRQRRVVQPGLYKVRISNAQSTIPTRYNKQTTLGSEVAFDSNRTEIPQFKLKTP